jgi:hypothetical protein
MCPAPQLRTVQPPPALVPLCAGRPRYRRPLLDLEGLQGSPLPGWRVAGLLDLRPAAAARGQGPTDERCGCSPSVDWSMGRLGMLGAAPLVATSLGKRFLPERILIRALPAVFRQSGGLSRVERDGIERCPRLSINSDDPSSAARSAAQPGTVRVSERMSPSVRPPAPSLARCGSGIWCDASAMVSSGVA